MKKQNKKGLIKLLIFCIFCIMILLISMIGYNIYNHYEIRSECKYLESKEDCSFEICIADKTNNPISRGVMNACILKNLNEKSIR